MKATNKGQREGGQRAGKAPGRDWARFDRADHIATTVLLWLVIGLSAGYAVFISLDWILRRRVTLLGVPVDVEDGAAGVGRVIGVAEAQVLVDSVSAGDFALLMAGVLAGVAATIWGGVLLTKLLRDLGQGEPFTRANVTRLRTIAVLLLVTPLLVSVLEAVARSAILAGAGDGGLGFTIEPGWVVAGLLVAATAQAFASGARLRADVDGLI
ncbi:DUF2975 domain-containing protein [Serinicoccus profundi]|uniref:DUF2975 domain-containing protein n=1 Tax=Serinicoccus profundi TaxID=1078471 RepID=UPI000255F84D|nr:DUF2975 domain-containing protein [Serinicoccus profundi]